MSQRMLATLCNVGMEQLSMQTIGAGSLDTQAGGALAGAAGLGAVDVALDRWVVPLVFALVSAIFAIRAILGTSLRGAGPTPTQILRGRAFLDEHRSEVVLDDDEAEWLAVGDIELSMRQNAAVLKSKATAVLRATISLLLGLVALVIFELGR